MTLPDRWLTCDPGEDFGWALWSKDQFVCHGTNKMWDVGDALTVAALRALGANDATPVVTAELAEDELSSLFSDQGGIQMLVTENWQLYPWVIRAGRLDWDECRTARIIGHMYGLCRLTGWKYEQQPALIKERAMAAGAEAYFSHPLRENRHQNDATMHGVFRIALESGAAWADLSQSSWNEDGTAA